MHADLRELIERADPGTRQLIFDAAGGVRSAALNTATMRVGLGPVSAGELALSFWTCKRTQSSQFGAGSGARNSGDRAASPLHQRPRR